MSSRHIENRLNITKFLSIPVLLLFFLLRKSSFGIKLVLKIPFIIYFYLKNLAMRIWFLYVLVLQLFFMNWEFVCFMYGAKCEKDKFLKIKKKISKKFWLKLKSIDLAGQGTFSDDYNKKTGLLELMTAFFFLTNPARPQTTSQFFIFKENSTSYVTNNPHTIL